MRVIAGSCRSLRLKTVDGKDTRPTTDRIKETLFNMISNTIPDGAFLDLFAGSGGIGIEALSRGAKECVFVEKNGMAIRVINENLEHTGLKELSTVYQSDALSALKRMENSKKFDVIFVDPPYDGGFYDEILFYLSKSKLIDEESLIIMESRKEEEFSNLEELGFQLIKEKIYKGNKHIFIERRGEKE